MKSPLRAFRLALVPAFALTCSFVTAAETPAPAELAAPKAPPTATLKDTFQKAFLVGVALNPRQFGDTDPQTTKLITSEFNCATAENDMKWELVEPKPDEFHFGAADRFIDFCQRYNLTVIGHNLCWHAQLPSWVSKPEVGQETLTREVLLERLRNHIQTVAGHFKGKVHGWDVVNEAIADGTGEYRNSVFYRVLGKEYLALAFKWAHEADPQAELYYNDYNLDADDAKRARAVELVKYLRDQGARIDGIGLQGHYNLTTPTAAKIDETIGIFASLGLKVMITELDVEAIHDRRVSGAVDANAGGNTWRPRFFPPMDEAKAKLSLTDAQVAELTPVIDEAGKEIREAITAAEYQRIGEIREKTTAAIDKILTESQRGPYAEMARQALIGPPPKPLTPEQQQELAQRYGEIFAVFLKHRADITRVTFWGLRDSESWRRRGQPLLFDGDFQRKPAYDAVIAAAKKAGL
ncbi:MAG TPA: endo-1,4-beta-xylanase [Lacunisphaera sp.]|jgi:endo-1,4-beta-xylanase|nr:endo-1,4-beta-xylanase [Lacunisphaera sp.]